MRGFLLALRDCCSEQSKSRALSMPADAPDRLGRLAFLDPEEERYRLALQRARKWMWELGVPVASERRDAIAKLAAMAASGAEPGERLAVRTVASERLGLAMRDGELPIEERSEAAVVLCLIGGEVAVATLEQVMGEETQPVALRRAAAEALGLSAVGAETQVEQRQRITAALEQQLSRQPLEVVVHEDSDWQRIDAALPLFQGAARGLQLAASRELPSLGSGAGRVVPMLTLTALNQEDCKGLELRTEVLETVEVWQLPLPEGEQLEMVLVPGGEYTIGSLEEREGQQGEAGRDVYPRFRQRCEGVNVEAQRRVRLEPTAMARFPISQAQWAAVAGLPLIEREIAASPGTYEAKGLWERFAQPGGLVVDSVSWFDCGEWLARLNHWLVEEWTALVGGTAAPQLALPSESRWEVACRSGSNTPFHCGDTLDPSWANYDANSTYGRGRKGEYHQRPTATGALAVVNRWGLAEMHGQLFEWCGDCWHPDPVGPGWRQDGSAWEESDAALEGLQDQEYRLLRGGSWSNFPGICRSAFRNSVLPVNRYGNVGFRVCCLPPGLPS